MHATIATLLDAARRRGLIPYGTLSSTTGPAPLAGPPAALDPALWFYGKWGCTRCEQRGHPEPISPLCQACRFDELQP